MRRLLPADFDPQVIAKYDITREGLDRVMRYLRLLQGPDAPALKDIAVGGYYGTSALLHEVVELGILLEREPGLLSLKRRQARAFWRRNKDAHVTALVTEYTYLQRQIGEVLGEKVEINALLWANTTRRDFDLLAESTWPSHLRIPDAAEVERARQLLARLRKVEL